MQESLETGGRGYRPSSKAKLPQRQRRYGEKIGATELARRYQLGLDLWSGKPIAAGSKDEHDWLLLHERMPEAFLPEYRLEQTVKNLFAAAGLHYQKKSLEEPRTKAA